MNTFRIRRVKCDESKPACQRCISTGRVCDGYGIWGGGGNTYGSAERIVNAFLITNPKSLRTVRLPTVPGLSQQECVAFDFFRKRTSTKLPGLFNSEFWERFVLQLSLREPPVLHSVIALAATHRQAIALGQAQRFSIPWHTAIMAPDERLALQQFNKAANCLRHLGIKDRHSLRITLVTCILFTCAELLKGEVGASQAHFRSGLNLLREMQHNSGSEPIDDHVAEAFTRLNIQSVILGQGPDHVYLTISREKETEIPLMFDSTSVARRHLDCLLKQIHELATQAKKITLSYGDITGRLVLEQERLQHSLGSWLRTLLLSLPRMRSTDQTDRFTLGLLLLRLHHSMAVIMAATCLQYGDEMSFDSHTSNFGDILEHAIDLWNKVVCLYPTKPPPGQSDHLIFTVDMGFIAPLYYTALRCRVPRYRRLAINLLSSAPQREGVWDGVLAAGIGSKIMELEEGAFYKNAGIEFAPLPQLPVGSIPATIPADDVPLVPRPSRVDCIKVILPEPGTENKVTLICKRCSEEVKVEEDWCSTMKVEVDMSPVSSGGFEMQQLSCHL